MTQTMDTSNDSPAGRETSLEQDWLYKLAVLSDRIARHTGKVAADVAGLNLSQWRVLVAIADREGRSASEVVELTPMDKGIVSRAVTHLVARGHLLRRQSQTDARRTHLFLTTEGRIVFDSISEELRNSGSAGDDLLAQHDAARMRCLIDSVLSRYPDEI